MLESGKTETLKAEIEKSWERGARRKEGKWGRI
jgi:hypothetical protein